MLTLLARSMFEATRIKPIGGVAAHTCAAAPLHHPLPRKERTIMPPDQHASRRTLFRQMHRGPQALVMPNAWDAGTARILAGLGFSALATTSAGLAFSMGLRDSSGSLSREQVLDNARSIVEATELPVSADLENGFGASPDACAQTVKEAGAIGLCGGAIEDATGDPDTPIYGFDHAVDRIAAAVAAKTSPDFLVTARAENFLYGRPDLDDTIRRLQAFEAVGADVVYAPGLPDLESIRRVCQSVSVPVNVVVGLTAGTASVADLSAAGVRRISTGGSLARAALGEMVRAATELRTEGTYGYAERAISDADAARHMRIKPAS